MLSVKSKRALAIAPHRTLVDRFGRAHRTLCLAEETFLGFAEQQAAEAESKDRAQQIREIAKSMVDSDDTELPALEKQMSDLLSERKDAGRQAVVAPPKRRQSSKPIAASFENGGGS